MVKGYLTSKEARQDLCTTYNDAVDKMGVLHRSKTNNHAQDCNGWQFGAADIRCREQGMAQQGDEALVAQEQGRGTADKRTPSWRELVTRSYRIHNPFDLLVSTSSEPRLRLYEMMDEDTELLNTPDQRDTSTDVPDDIKDVPANDAASHNLRERARGTRLEEVTLSVPQGGCRRLGKLNRRIKRS